LGAEVDRHDEDVADGVHPLPGRSRDQVVHAVPLRLAARVGDELEDGRRVRVAVPRGARDALLGHTDHCGPGAAARHGVLAFPTSAGSTGPRIPRVTGGCSCSGADGHADAVGRLNPSTSAKYVSSCSPPSRGTTWATYWSG